MAVARDVYGVIAGEAVSGTPQERWADMLAIASVIQNRATQLGVPVEQVIANSNEFNAFGKSLPAGAESYTDMAKAAMDYVAQNGPVTQATFYATPAATDSLPNGLLADTQTTGHEFFTDPLNRAIGTAQGYVKPSANTSGLLPAQPSSLTGLLASPAPQASPFDSILAQPAPAAAAPVSSPVADDLGNGMAKLPSVSFDMGPHRPYAPNEDVINTAQQAVDSVLGPDAHISLTSGTEGAGLAQFGSNRHKTGLAGDFTFTTPTGHVLSWTNPQDLPALRDIAQAAAAIDGSNIGLGYAGAPSMMHIDNVPASQLSPGQDQEWGLVGNQMSGILADARLNKEMPASYWDRIANQVQTSGVVPSLLDRNDLQVANANGIMNTVDPVSVPEVVQGPSLPAPSVMASYQPEPAKQAMPSYQSLLSAPVAPNFDMGLLAAANPTIAAPTMQDFSIPASVAPAPAAPAIAGPATDQIATPAQQTAQVAAQQPSFGNVASFPAAPKEPGVLGKMGITKESVIGGALGGSLLGPLGAVGGSLLGNYLSNNPQGFSGLLGSFRNQPMTINNLGTGVAAFNGVYGPGATRGNTFTANNGATVTALGDGSFGYVNKSGVHEVHDADGNVASVW